MEESHSTSETFVSDEPEVEKDEFKRKPFAQRIAQILHSRKEASSIVVGIYGEWGEGKTTVLNFIEKELEGHQNLICIRYNPWYYSDEVMLLQDFFNLLADKLETVSQSTDFKEQVKKYGKHLSQLAISKSATLNFGPLQVNPFSSDSFIDLTESKKRIQETLKKNDIRIIILMDDIDRLDKIEIQSIFKLLKLSADFNYVDYILAFDEKMVASALGEKYGSSDIEAGRNFLEKIINVPLHLPKAGEVSLFNFLRDGVNNNVLQVTDTKLTEEEYTTFLIHFSEGIKVRSKTPRMIKRYQNALLFSLPILKEEVNIVDLMLIEAIRVFYPKIYNVIRDNAEVFIDVNLFSTEDDEKKNFDKVNDFFKELSITEHDSLKDLLGYLFPKSQNLFENKVSLYPLESKESLIIKQRISSPRYFERYFSYTIPAGDIPDLEIKQFVKSVVNDDNFDRKEIEKISKSISEIIEAHGLESTEVFISKISSIQNDFSKSVALKLSLALAQFSRQPDTSTTRLMIQLLASGPSKQRYEFSELIVGNVASTCLSLKFFYLVRKYKLFSQDEIQNLSEIILNRIKNKMSESEQPIYINCPCASNILIFLSSSSYKEKTKEYVEKTLTQNLDNGINLLKCFYMTEILEGRRTFEEDNYNSLREIIDPDILYNILHESYGNIMEKQDEDIIDLEENEDKRFLKQFAQIHKSKRKKDAENSS